MDAPAHRHRCRTAAVRVAVILTVLPLAAILSACAPGTTSPAGPETTVPTGNAPGILTYEVDADRMGMLALGWGVLVFTDGCLRLQDGTILVFPDDSSSWDGTTLRYSGSEFRMGDEISFGGGQSSLTPEIRDIFEIPEECGDGPVWIVAPGLLED